MDSITEVRFHTISDGTKAIRTSPIAKDGNPHLDLSQKTVEIYRRHKKYEPQVQKRS